MSLLILLSLPALSGLVSMAAAITVQTLYPRLQGRGCMVISFPGPLERMTRYGRARRAV